MPFSSGKKMAFFEMNKNLFPIWEASPRSRPEPVVSGVVLLPQMTPL